MTVRLLSVALLVVFLACFIPWTAYKEDCRRYEQVIKEKDMRILRLNGEVWGLKRIIELRLKKG